MFCILVNIQCHSSFIFLRLVLSLGFFLFFSWGISGRRGASKKSTILLFLLVHFSKATRPMFSVVAAQSSSNHPSFLKACSECLVITMSLLEPNIQMHSTICSFWKILAAFLVSQWRRMKTIHSRLHSSFWDCLYWQRTKTKEQKNRRRQHTKKEKQKEKTNKKRKRKRGSSQDTESLDDPGGFVFNAGDEDYWFGSLPGILAGLEMSDLWMWGMTPPPAMVALIRVSSSSSPRMASCRWRGVMRFTLRSLEALPASSSTSAVRYSRMAALYTAAVAPTRPPFRVFFFRMRCTRPTGNYNREKVKGKERNKDKELESNWIRKEARKKRSKKQRRRVEGVPGVQPWRSERRESSWGSSLRRQRRRLSCHSIFIKQRKKKHEWLTHIRNTQGHTQILNRLERRRRTEKKKRKKKREKKKEKKKKRRQKEKKFSFFLLFFFFWVDASHLFNPPTLHTIKLAMEVPWSQHEGNGDDYNRIQIHFKKNPLQNQFFFFFFFCLSSNDGVGKEKENQRRLTMIEGWEEGDFERKFKEGGGGVDDEGIEKWKEKKKIQVTFYMRDREVLAGKKMSFFLAGFFFFFFFLFFLFFLFFSCCFCLFMHKQLQPRGKGQVLQWDKRGKEI